ncbi:hypothetical protein HK100_004436, partial [Physocladia obscura]
MSSSPTPAMTDSASSNGGDTDITGFCYCPPGWDEQRLRAGPDADAIAKIAIDTFTDIAYIKEKNAIQIIGELHEEVYAAQTKLNDLFFPVIVRSKKQWTRPDRPGNWGQRRDSVAAPAGSAIGKMTFISNINGCNNGYNNNNNNGYHNGFSNFNSMQHQDNNSYPHGQFQQPWLQQQALNMGSSFYTHNDSSYQRPSNRPASQRSSVSDYNKRNSFNNYGQESIPPASPFSR